MNRRAASAALMLPISCGTSFGPPGQPSTRSALPGGRTEWSFKTSEGLDAIAFLGPLSGKTFYAEHYAPELEAFKPRLGAEAIEVVASLFRDADRDGYLLWPNLALILSGHSTETIDDLLHGLANTNDGLRQTLAASPYWDAAMWAQFERLVPRLQTHFEALASAGFPAFRHGLIAPAEARCRELLQRFSGVDVIGAQEHLLGHRLDPRIEMSLLWFCRPHGVKIQGQRFIAHVLASDAAIALTAAHEPLHPPFDMKAATATRCIERLAADTLMQRILAEKDKDTGYNSIEGLFEEDVVQALDQLVQERLGYGKAPARRWAESDQGMHVFAAALYGLLKAERFEQTGGNIEAWLGAAEARGKLAPSAWHPAAAAVLGRPANLLWSARGNTVTPPSRP